jgi:hypothetical protein
MRDKFTKSDLIDDHIHRSNGFVREFCYIHNSNKRIKEEKSKLKEKFKERKEKKNERN